MYLEFLNVAQPAEPRSSRWDWWESGKKVKEKNLSKRPFKKQLEDLSKPRNRSLGKIRGNITEGPSFINKLLSSLILKHPLKTFPI